MRCQAKHEERRCNVEMRKYLSRSYTAELNECFGAKVVVLYRNTKFELFLFSIINDNVCDCFNHILPICSRSRWCRWTFTCALILINIAWILPRFWLKSFCYNYCWFMSIRRTAFKAIFKYLIMYMWPWFSLVTWEVGSWYIYTKCMLILSIDVKKWK